MLHIETLPADVPDLFVELAVTTVHSLIQKHEERATVPMFGIRFAVKNMVKGSFIFMGTVRCHEELFPRRDRARVCTYAWRQSRGF